MQKLHKSGIVLCYGPEDRFRRCFPAELIDFWFILR